MVDFVVVVVERIAILEIAFLCVCNYHSATVTLTAAILTCYSIGETQTSFRMSMRPLVVVSLAAKQLLKPSDGLET